MDGWSLLTEGSGLNCLETLHKFQSNGFPLDHDVSLKSRSESGEEKLRFQFDRILTACLKEISDSRPLPVMVGDGRSLDLFKLYWVVKGKSGYESVTKNRLWPVVADELGLGSQFGSSVKLIYAKYLNVLDIWLQTFVNEKGVAGSFSDQNCFRSNRRSLPIELKPDVEALLCELSKLNKLHKSLELDCVKKEVQTPPTENGHVVIGSNLSAKESEHDISPCISVNDEVKVLDPNLKNGYFSSLKRKQESLMGMLNWLKTIAKNPGDPMIKKIPEGSRQKEHDAEELWAQTLAVRKALLLRRHVYSSPGISLLQKRQKIHPSIYESSTGLRCSQRLLSLHSNQNSSPASSSATFSISSEELIKRPLRPLDSSGMDPVVNPFSKDQLQKRVPVGSVFQAQVPDWTGRPKNSSHCYADDSRWLGTQFWPVKVTGRRCPIERDPIGKGRPNSCGCQIPGSADCVRFHVSEKRARLKLELGSAFYSWRFDKMGEDVSQYWTDQEERQFKSIVRLNPPSLGTTFWDQIFKCFPSKSRKSLVGYYFNVFVLRRRSFQNRLTPNSIDSDDDELEFGSVTDSLGVCTAKAVKPKSVFCVENRQFVDLEGMDLDRQ